MNTQCHFRDKCSCWKALYFIIALGWWICLPVLSLQIFIKFFRTIFRVNETNYHVKLHARCFVKEWGSNMPFGNESRSCLHTRTCTRTHIHKITYNWNNLPQFQALRVVLGFQLHLALPVITQMSVSGPSVLSTWWVSKFRTSICLKKATLSVTPKLLYVTLYQQQVTCDLRWQDDKWIFLSQKKLETCKQWHLHKDKIHFKKIISFLDFFLFFCVGVYKCSSLSKVSKTIAVWTLISVWYPFMFRVPE